MVVDELPNPPAPKPNPPPAENPLDVPNAELAPAAPGCDVKPKENGAVELTGLSLVPKEKGELELDVLGAPNAAWPRGVGSDLGVVSDMVTGDALELEPSGAVLVILGSASSFLSNWSVISAR